MPAGISSTYNQQAACARRMRQPARWQVFHPIPMGIYTLHQAACQ